MMPDWTNILERMGKVDAFDLFYWTYPVPDSVSVLGVGREYEQVRYLTSESETSENEPSMT